MCDTVSVLSFPYDSMSSKLLQLWLRCFRSSHSRRLRCSFSIPRVTEHVIGGSRGIGGGRVAADPAAAAAFAPLPPLAGDPPRSDLPSSREDEEDGGARKPGPGMLPDDMDELWDEAREAKDGSASAMVESKGACLSRRFARQMLLL